MKLKGKTMTTIKQMQEIGCAIQSVKDAFAVIGNALQVKLEHEPQKGPPLRIYISGPMTGVDDYNYPQSFKWQVLLEDAGHTVENPAMHDIQRIKKGWRYKPEMREELIAEDCELIKSDKVDAIFLLKGYSNSYGARREHDAANYKSKRVFYEGSDSDLLKLLGYIPSLEKQEDDD